MIGYLEGNIILKQDKFIIVQAGQIGYKVFLSQKTLSRLEDRGSSTKSGLSLPDKGGPINPVRNSPPLGHSGAHSAGEISNGVKIFIYHNIGEKASDLYGFLTPQDLEFFEILMDVRGVGPKAALEISAVGPLDRIKDKILKQDENVFAGIPGIGSKKAMTIMLELTGKIKLPGSKKSVSDEAESALVQLGFSRQQAKDALSHIPSSIKDTEERIKVALKNLGK